MSRVIKWLVLLFLVAIAGAGGLLACRTWLHSDTVPQTHPTLVPARSTPTASADEKDLTRTRLEMVERTIKARGVSDPSVLRAMEEVPRHLFVPADYVAQAYADHPLPIGHGQTISQPFIVALMTELLDLRPGERVLEVGTGSAYQAAVLAEIVSEVYTVEIIPALAETASQRLQDLGYVNVRTKQADGYYGWKEHAPFDAIIVTCAPDHVPQPLVNQLAPGGRLVVPIGPPGAYQNLWQYVLEPDGLKAYNLGGVRFVPLLGEVPQD